MNYAELIRALDDAKLAPIIERLPTDFPNGFKHGDLPGWIRAIRQLPALEPASYELAERIRIGEAGQCDDSERALIKGQLLQLHPWRKGPYELFGLLVDAEWRSDLKWRRLEAHLSPLAGRKVLDVGCGNGYYCWRMAGTGAKLALGIDSHLLFTLQYWAIRRFLKTPPVHVAPLALEELPSRLRAFDTVFSMGVLYHRRSPLDHLQSLMDCLRDGGELALETIVIEGPRGMTLVPQGRYARMPNVWFLPSCGALEDWLLRTGFRDIRLVNLSATTPQEQRSTQWMRFESLSQALQPDKPHLTVEGHPAPQRAIFIAAKP